MKVLNFREWLEGRHALGEWLRARIDFLDRSGKYPSFEITALSYIGLAFPWIATPEGSSYWHRLDAEWLREARDNETVAGMPLDDPLALALLLAELEAGNGNSEL